MSDNAIEYQFLDEWKSWDELNVGVICFYNVKLKKDVFPFPIKEDVIYNLLVDVNSCYVEVFEQDALNNPIFTSKFKAVLI